MTRPPNRGDAPDRPNRHPKLLSQFGRRLARLLIAGVRRQAHSTMLNNKRIRRAITRVRIGLSRYGVTSSVFLKDIDFIVRTIENRRTEINRKVNKAFQIELDLAYLYVVTTTLFLSAFSESAFERNREDEPQWQRRYRFVAHDFLLQLTNFGLSTLRLIQDGQDNGARVLVRTTAELSWQTLICLAKNDYLDSWLEGGDSESSSRVWNQLFRGKIGSLLQDIEHQLETPEDITKQLAKARIASMKFYSQAVHHSFAATVFGNLAPSLDKPEVTVGTTLFGAASGSLETPLTALNGIFFYFYFLFPRIIEQIRGYPVSRGEVLWNSATSLGLTCAIVYNKLFSESDAEPRSTGSRSR